MKFINVGFGNMVASERVVTIVSPDSAPIKRLVQAKKNPKIERTKKRRVKFALSS